MANGDFACGNRQSASIKLLDDVKIELAGGFELRVTGQIFSSSGRFADKLDER